MFDYTFTLNKNQLSYIRNFIEFQINIIESSNDLNDLFYNKILNHVDMFLGIHHKQHLLTEKHIENLNNNAYMQAFDIFNEYSIDKFGIIIC